MSHEEIKEYVRKERNRLFKDSFKMWFWIGVVFSSVFAFLALFWDCYNNIWERMGGSFFVFAIGILISVSQVFWRWFMEIKYYNPNKFNVEIARIEDKSTTDHWQEDMENRHFNQGVTCSLKIGGRYHGCSDRIYMRANKGQYYLIVFSGRKKRRFSKIIGLFEA